jgi:hypothetical protein
MKRLILVVMPVAVLTLVAGVAFAQMAWMGPGMGMGWGHGHGMMGPGMMGGGQGWYGCPGAMGGMMGPGMMGGPGWTSPQTPLTEEKAKELAQQYADSYLKGFTVERVLPFAGMGMTMYQAELKGPNDESRVLHINPWGNVMPFGGPWRRAG